MDYTCWIYWINGVIGGSFIGLIIYPIAYHKGWVAGFEVGKK